MSKWFVYLVFVAYAGTTVFEMDHISSKSGALAPPGIATQQTAALILDVNRDGWKDFVLASRREGPSVVWYRRHATGWTRHILEAQTLPIEAGGAFHDIDGDGDLDVVLGGDSNSNQVWWWENPYPSYPADTSWTRRLVKSSGSKQHHDQLFGDFDGDGQAELVFWNQGARRLLMAEIPANPRETQPWPSTVIHGGQGQPEHEGLAQADVDGDGKVDIVGGGHWFKHEGGTSFTPHLIDHEHALSRAATGQLKEGGAPEVVFVSGDQPGYLKWYEWTGADWIGHQLLPMKVRRAHSLQVEDMNGDGHLDIFCAEMRLNGENPDAKMWVLLGNGSGGFSITEVASGYGNHESKTGDLNGDGSPDILGKPYNWDTPRVDIWLSPRHLVLDRWQRHEIDAHKPWRSLFVASADMDTDGQSDIVTGGWWYRNPGNTGGVWARNPIGQPLKNVAALNDFDGDGDIDVLGTQGRGSRANPQFAWARNEGAGTFTILTNLQAGDGDFLQGVAVNRFDAGGPTQVALSWHEGGKGIQRLTVPPDPSSGIWTRDLMSPTSQDEALSAGDIDGDGDVDLLLGTRWLRNDGGAWSEHNLWPTGAPPDRNRLADINRDGRPDAVVGYEAIGVPGKLAWYQQGENPTGTWLEHVIAQPVGPMSLDVADMDGDGDLDVILGEHNTEHPAQSSLFIFENVDSLGNDWQRHLVHQGDEHHNGAQVVDIDGDGDLDILSIGWTHDRVLLYENKAFP